MFSTSAAVYMFSPKQYMKSQHHLKDLLFEKLDIATEMEIIAGSLPAVLSQPNSPSVRALLALVIENLSILFVRRLTSRPARH